MDAVELRAKAQAARRFVETEGEWQLTLQTPTRREIMQLAHERGINLDDDALASSALTLLYYGLVDRYLVGWSGLRESDIVPAAGADPLAWSPETVPLWSDAHPAVAMRIGRMLYDRAIKRAAATEATAKN